MTEINPLLLTGGVIGAITAILCGGLRAGQRQKGHHGL